MGSTLGWHLCLMGSILGQVWGIWPLTFYLVPTQSPGRLVQLLIWWHLLSASLSHFLPQSASQPNTVCLWGPLPSRLPALVSITAGCSSPSSLAWCGLSSHPCLEPSEHILLPGLPDPDWTVWLLFKPQLQLQPEHAHLRQKGRASLAQSCFLICYACIAIKANHGEGGGERSLGRDRGKFKEKMGSVEKMAYKNGREKDSDTQKRNQKQWAEGSQKKRSRSVSFTGNCSLGSKWYIHCLSLERPTILWWPLVTSVKGTFSISDL